MKKQIVIIEQALNEGDPGTVSKEAHSIKGGASNLTADELSNAANELEKTTVLGHSKKTAEKVDNLVKAFSRLESYIKNLK